MKKKQYQQPTIKTVKIQQAQMLCGSVNNVTTSGLDGEEKLDYDKSDNKSLWDDAW